MVATGKLEEPAAAALARKEPEHPADRPMIGARVLCQALQREGVDTIFGYPGGVGHPALRCSARVRASTTCWYGTSRAPDTRLTAMLARPARLASVWQPPGPGRPTWSRRSRRRCSTPSRWSRSPARCRKASSASDAFQEIDITGITLPITKHNFLVRSVAGHRPDDPEGVPPGEYRTARSGPGRHPERRAAGKGRTRPSRRSSTCRATSRPTRHIAARFELAAQEMRNAQQAADPRRPRHPHLARRWTN